MHISTCTAPHYVTTIPQRYMSHRTAPIRHIINAPHRTNNHTINAPYRTYMLSWVFPTPGNSDDHTPYSYTLYPVLHSWRLPSSFQHHHNAAESQLSITCKCPLFSPRKSDRFYQNNYFSHLSRTPFRPRTFYNSIKNFTSHLIPITQILLSLSDRSRSTTLKVLISLRIVPVPCRSTRK
ncbi:hypothetical protein BDN72DRAFT_498013 [Pluteus cervinus]|uniref:Uncharacterized protein n=1 Tax=Pluteus cervinus TaxID=181527 RepID=A0ACD3A5V6_9AGAR|nr:hypothetical protein BDN72DRAFT_498013 [Pluteus cervinus]